MKKNNMFSVRTLVLLSLFSALSIVLTRFFSLMLYDGVVRLGIGSVPIILSGLLFGPVAGGAVGIVSDLLGVIVNPYGNFNPGITLCSALTGILPGMVVMLTRKKDLKTVVLSHVLVYAFVGLILKTYFLSLLFVRSYFALLPIRAVFEAIVSIISIVLVKILIDRLGKFNNY